MKSRRPHCPIRQFLVSGESGTSPRVSLFSDRREGEFYSNWSFKPIDGATVIFETGLNAKDFMKNVRDVNIEAAGEGEEGFAKYRITM